MLRRLLALLLSFLVATPVLGASAPALPHLDSETIRLLAGTQEEHIGRSIVNELRRSNLVLDDPELTEYIQNLGSRLVAEADNGGTQFTFFVVRDDSINAFALPGGYIGVHTGLIARTGTESELASVLAHEIVHVTQRHVARRFEASSGMGLKSIALLLGAIALVASGADGDDISGAMMLGQGLALQEQINFTRTQEYEADRIGIEMLARAGFDPAGAIAFFNTMQRVQRLQNSHMPEFMSTHPLSLSRISEAAQRVQAMERPAKVAESRNYPLMKARLGALAGADPLLLGGGQDDAARYGRALHLMRKGDAHTAVTLLEQLLKEDDSITNYHIALGNALLETGERKRALATFEHASHLFPGNVPVGLAHATALRRSGQADRALALLRDLFNRVEPEPEYVRITAHTAAEAGATAESHFYMSEYYLRTGDLDSARVQLRLAVDSADPASREGIQYQARLEEVTAAVIEARRSQPRRSPPGQNR